MTSKLILSIALAATTSPALAAPLKVLATTTDLAAIVAEVGGEDVQVEALAKGAQDPHYLEAKPSLMVKANAADLIVAVGLALEDAWLNNVIKGGRNPKLFAGQSGYLEVGPTVDVLEAHHGAATRDQGDVHPDGNPHVTLDPVRAGLIAQTIATRLGQLAPDKAAAFKVRANKLKARLDDKAKAWGDRIKASGVTKVVTYHKTLNYFLDRFGLKAVAYLEPLPGVPPTARHIMGVIKTVKDDGIKLILVENYYDDRVADRIQQDVKDVRIVSVPVAVGGAAGIDTLDDLYEALVSIVDGKRP